MIDSVRLCVESGNPIDPGNYVGSIHCITHPDGYPCTTALYDRREGTMDTAADRQVRPVLHNRAAYNCREHRPHDAVLHGAWCLICGEER